MIKTNKDYISIYNPLDVPFGKLSIKYVDNKVSNEMLIYSGLLTGTYKLSLLASKNPQNDYFLISNEIERHNIRDALDMAITARFKDTELANLLIQTGDRYLEYDNMDKLLGNAKGSGGWNLVGKILMQERQKLIKERETIFRENRIIDLKDNLSKTFVVIATIRIKCFIIIYIK